MVDYDDKIQFGLFYDTVGKIAFEVTDISTFFFVGFILNLELCIQSGIQFPTLASGFLDIHQYD